MKKLFCICAALYACFTLNAQMKPQTFDLWPQGKMPGAVANAPEKSEYSKDWQFTIVSNVSKPTLEVFRAKTKGPTGFVLICPGGSYEILAYDLEGTEIAQKLAESGISAGVLKYRVPGNRDGALMDAQRAIRLVRANAKKWKVDPGKICVMGFSAGGNLAARASSADNASYKDVDAADKNPPKPDFTALVYPAYCDSQSFLKHWKGGPEIAHKDYDSEYELSPELSVGADTPPVFIVGAQDDYWVNSSIAYYAAMKKAGRPADMHLFSQGGHGFGLRKAPGKPVEQWFGLLEEWLRFNNLLKKQ